MSVRENILQLKKEIPDGVCLVAVSKTKSNEMILEAYNEGQRDFGENYVQELIEKENTLPKDIRWHFIGHLQSNKVKYIAPFVYLIHGVDSLKLLQEINKQALKSGRVISCLLQIFIAQEETKFGLSLDECETLINSDAFKSMKNIVVKGFMAMASNTDDENQIKHEFTGLKVFSEKMKQYSSSNFDPGILSYGMSGDYKLAINCGSNMLRIGSTIFGERSYLN